AHKLAVFFLVTEKTLMPIVGIDHVQLAMPAGEEARARAFYGEVLGLPETPKPPDSAKRGGCWFESDRVKIHLGVDSNFHPATRAHPGLLVDDLQEVIDRCRQQGIKCSDSAQIEGYRRIF